MVVYPMKRQFCNIVLNITIKLTKAQDEDGGTIKANSGNRKA